MFLVLFRLAPKNLGLTFILVGVFYLPCFVFVVLHSTFIATAMLSHLMAVEQTFFLANLINAIVCLSFY